MKPSKFKSWERVAKTIQNQITTNKTVMSWWDNNFKAVNSREGEYPVSENLPLLEEYESITIIQPKKCDVSRNLVVDAIVDIYWWNLDPSHFSKARIKLPKSLLEIIKWRYLDGLSNKQIRDTYGLTKNNINKRVRRLAEKLDLRIKNKGVYVW